MTRTRSPFSVCAKLCLFPESGCSGSVHVLVLLHAVHGPQVLRFGLSRPRRVTDRSVAGAGLGPRRSGLRLEEDILGEIVFALMKVDRICLPSASISVRRADILAMWAMSFFCEATVGRSLKIGMKVVILKSSGDLRKRL